MLWSADPHKNKDSKTSEATAEAMSMRPFNRRGRAVGNILDVSFLLFKTQHSRLATSNRY